MLITRRKLMLFAIAAALCALGFQAAKAPVSSDPLVAAFQKIPTASLADAVDQVAAQRGFMAHDMRPRTGGRFAGRAWTALLKPAPPEQATPQLSTKHSIEMIDQSKPGDVGVIVIEDGLDVAAMGGLMGTTAKVRGMAGLVLDGGLRDVEEVRALGLSVYSRSITPATSVGRYASVANQVAVKCAGVTVSPGDIIVADEDGVVAIPQSKAEEVLKKAREIDERERKMVPMIREHKSLSKVVALFNRI